MHLAKKNIFGFATIAATVTLSAAIFATGCGDSGDSTAVNPLNPDKIANAITVNYDPTTEANLINSKVESLRWIITDTDSGKQLAIRDTAQKINYTGTTTKANAALAEEDTTSNDTTADEIPASATQNDKCYVVLGVPSTVFQKMENVTLTYIYYGEDGKVVGFGTDKLTSENWNNDKSGKRYSGTVADGNFFSVEGVESELVATPEFINKGETTKLAYNVTKGEQEANIIGLVDVEVGYDDEDKDYYIKPSSNGIVGAYEGVNFTKESGVYVNAKFDKNATNPGTYVYVTDCTPTALGVSTTSYRTSTTVLVPENVKAEGQTKAADYALGQTTATDSNYHTTYGIRQLPLRVYVSDWSDGQGAKPSANPTVGTDKVTFAVKDSAQKAFKAEDVAVENGVVKFKQSKLDAAVPFTVVATYGEATGKLEGSKAVPATVEVGFAGKDATEFTTEVKGDSTKDVTANLKMYARFVADGVDSLSLFEIPSDAGFTYPSTAALFDGDTIYKGEGATVTIATAEQQKANDYSVTIKQDNKVNELKVKFLEKETTPYADQIKAFGAFTKLNIDNLLNMVIAPNTEVDPTPSPSPAPGGNEDPDAGDQP